MLAVKEFKHLEEYSFDFMDKLQKGDEFVLNKKKYFVKCIGKYKLLKNQYKTITIKSDLEQIKFFYVFGCYSGNPLSMGRTAHTKHNNFLRNVEGCILVDIVNNNNIFHEPSDVYKISTKQFVSLNSVSLK